MAVKHLFRRELNLIVQNDRKPWWQIKTLWLSVICFQRYVVHLMIYLAFPDWISYDTFSVMFMGCNFTICEDLCIGGAVIFFGLFHALVERFKKLDVKCFNFLQEYYLKPSSIFLSSESVPRDQSRLFHLQRKIFKLESPPNRLSKFMSDHFPDYFDHNRLVDAAFVFKARNPSLGLLDKYNILLLVNCIELGCTHFVVVHVLAVTFIGVFISCKIMDSVASVSLLVLDLSLYATLFNSFAPDVVLFCGTIIFIIKLTKNSFYFCTRTIREMLAQNEAAKRRFYIFERHLIHNLTLILDLDKTLVSNLLLLTYAVSTPMNIFIVLVVYLRCNICIPAYICYLTILAHHFAIFLFSFKTLAKVADPAYESEHYLLPFQYRLKARDVRLKIRVMRMYEILHTDDRVSFSINSFGRITRLSLLHFIAIYMCHCLMLAPIIKKMFQ